MSESARTSGRQATPSALPFASMVFGSPNSNAPRTADTVRSPARISPGSAACSSRAATLTASPLTKELPSRGRPTTTSPVLTPIRSDSSPAKTASSRRCIANAVCKARSAWSSSASGAPNAAITASPANFSTVPPAPSISRAHRVVEALQAGARPFGILLARGRGRVDEIREEDRGELALGVIGHVPSLAQNRPQVHFPAVFDTLSDRLQGALGDLRGRGKLDEEAISRAMREIRLALLEADVNFEVVKQFVAQVRERALGQEVLKSLQPGQQVVKAVHDELTALMGQGSSQLAFTGRPPTVILLAGLQGSGKTTAAAKLALLLRKEGRSPGLVAADLQRPAAIDQLEQLGKQIQVPVYRGEGTDPVAVVRDGVRKLSEDGVDTIILDTAGRLHVDEELMQELERVRDEAKPANVLLVVDAMTGQEAVNVALAFQERIAFDGVVMTKLDGDARGGAALSVKAVTGRPIKLISVGEKLDQLEYFHPDRMASRILGMGDVLTLIERAEEAVEEDEQKDMEARMMKGQFTFDDFLKSYKMLRRMGPIQGVLKMIPGLGKQLEGMDQVDEKQLGRVEAIILSMTPQERGLPKVIDGSRRQRIAHGSGTTVEEVNRLMDARKQMEKLMKGMSKGKMPDLGALTGQSEATVPQPGQRKATKSNKRKKRQKSRR